MNCLNFEETKLNKTSFGAAFEETRMMNISLYFLSLICHTFPLLVKVDPRGYLKLFTCDKLQN